MNLHRTLLLASLSLATAAGGAGASPALAVPDGCAANPECLVEGVLGGSAPVLPAAAAGSSIPSLAVVDASHRGRHAVVRVRVTGIGLLRARAAGAPRRVRRLAGSGVHELKIPLGRSRRIHLSIVDGAGRRDTASVTAR
jgi:hypothetical protein